MTKDQKQVLWSAECDVAKQRRQFRWMALKGAVFLALCSSGLWFFGGAFYRDLTSGRAWGLGDYLGLPFGVFLMLLLLAGTVFSGLSLFAGLMSKPLQSHVLTSKTFQEVDIDGKTRNSVAFSNVVHFAYYDVHGDLIFTVRDGGRYDRDTCFSDIADAKGAVEQLSELLPQIEFEH